MRIALIGQLGTGKSHVAQIIRDAADFEQISFGQEVYRVAELAIGRRIDKSLRGDRKLLTDVGTHWGRNGDPVAEELEDKLAKAWEKQKGYPDIWVDALAERVSREDPSVPLILDDLRFPNELRFLLAAGFHVFLVLCSLQTRNQRLELRGDPYAVAVDAHLSEAFPTWITGASRAKIMVPTLWNDPSPAPSNEARGLITSVDQAVSTLKDGSFPDNHDLDKNNSLWRLAVTLYERSQ